MLTIFRHVLNLNEPQLDAVFVIVLSKFAHYWVFFPNGFTYLWEC